MIQRIQTLYLLIAAVLMSVVLFIPSLLPFSPLVPRAFLTVFFAVIAAIPLITIFLYKRRRLQIGFCIAEIILLLGAVIATTIELYGICNGSAPMFLQNGVPIILMILSLAVVILAMRAISRDEKLVRSLDRLR